MHSLVKQFGSFFRAFRILVIPMRKKIQLVVMTAAKAISETIGKYHITICDKTYRKITEQQNLFNLLLTTLIRFLWFCIIFLSLARSNLSLPNYPYSERSNIPTSSSSDKSELSCKDSGQDTVDLLMNLPPSMKSSIIMSWNIIGSIKLVEQYFITKIQCTILMLNNLSIKVIFSSTVVSWQIELSWS